MGSDPIVYIHAVPLANSLLLDFMVVMHSIFMSVSLWMHRAENYVHGKNPGAESTRSRDSAPNR